MAVNGSLRRAAALVVINLLVFGVLMEIAGLLFHFFTSGSLLYLDRPVYQLATDAASEQLTNDVLNPYFGPSHKPGIPFEVPPDLREEGREPARVATNNFGFVSPFNYPIVRAQNEFIIGIFGGSVGVWFCQVGVDRLLEHLRQHEFFRARTLVPLCMAHEGYKQPQQLLVLSYFLSIGQPFDLVINIDGLNEVALSAANNQLNLDISMPSATHLIPLINLIDKGTLTPHKLETLSTIARYRARLNDVSVFLNRNRSAGVGLVGGWYRSWLVNRYNRALREFDSLPSTAGSNSLVSAIPPTEQRTGAMLFDEIARNWAKASQGMRTLLSAEGVSYVHVLQPNQYFTSRKFTAEEAKVALDPSSPFKAGVEQGYPALLSEAAKHDMDPATGFFDGTKMFDSEPAAVYTDNCCHYTRVGNLRLADFLARSVLATSGPWRRASQP
jgi:hypothetical protein